MSRWDHLKNAVIGSNEPPANFLFNPQKELGYYIVSGELLQAILWGKGQISLIRTDTERLINWTLLNAKKAATYRKLLTVLMDRTTRTNNLIQQWVLPFYQPEKRSDKETKVRGYAKQYISTQNDTLLLLSDLEGTHITKQRVLAFQRIISHYSIYFTLAEYLNGITPDREFVIPTKDRTYVLPSPMMGNQQGQYPPNTFSQPKNLEHETQKWGQPKNVGGN